MLPIFIAAIGDPAEQAFYTNLFHIFYPLMKSQAYNVTKNMADADDAVQDALIRLLGKYDLLSSRSEGARALYIKLTVKTAAIDIMRKKGRAYSRLSELDPEWTSGEEDTPEHLYLRTEKTQALAAAVRELPEQIQELLLFKYVLEKPTGELARLMGTTPANIRMMLSRTRRKLYLALEGI